MSNIVKRAYDAGARQALIDAGLIKQANDPLMSISPEHDAAWNARQADDYEAIQDMNDAPPDHSRTPSRGDIPHIFEEFYQRKSLPHEKSIREDEAGMSLPWGSSAY